MPRPPTRYQFADMGAIRMYVRRFRVLFFEEDLPSYLQGANVYYPLRGLTLAWLSACTQAGCLGSPPMPHWRQLHEFLNFRNFCHMSVVFFLNAHVRRNHPQHVTEAVESEIQTLVQKYTELLRKMQPELDIPPWVDASLAPPYSYPPRQ